ncbi:MAG: cyclic nucleotide-binding domain-containing protein [Lachnospiraceae bacterium]|nr:cyclic nucleotide-binding domain-containing protein [Lachnospiraceae bacterium]
MTKQFKKGEVIFREGEMGDTLYQIEEGTVSIYAAYEEKEQQLLTQLGKGKIFGEMAVVEAYPRSATAVAEDDVTVLEVESSEVADFFKTNPDRIMDIMKSLSGRLRSLTADYSDVSNTVSQIRNSADKEFGGALADLIIRFATAYKRNKAINKLSVEADRILSQNGHSEGYAVKVEDFDKGQIIFKEGEVGDCMYDIHSGTIGIYEGYGTSDEKLLTKLNSNMFFGELGMIDKVERSCTAVVMENNTTLEIITESDIKELFEKNPAKVQMILEHLSYRVRHLTSEYMNACKVIYRVNEAKNKGDIDEGLKSEVKKCND